MRLSALGLDRADYTPGRDATHMAIPLAITGPTADVAAARALAVAASISDVVDQIEHVRWIATHFEAAYALLANLTTSLETLSVDQRRIVLGASPATEKLARLLLEASTLQ